MSFGTEMQAVAKELLTEFGEVVTVTVTTGGSYDPTTSSVTGATNSSYSGVGHPEPYSSSQIATGVVRVDDVKLLFYSDSGVPEIGNIISLRNKDYNVLNVDRLAVQGLNAAYILQLRV